MVAQGLVKILSLQDGRIEPREQLCSDDENLERIVRVAETVKELFFGIAISPVCLVAVFLVVVRVHDDCDRISAQELVELLFIQQAALSVVADYLRLEAVGLNLRFEVFGNVFTHLVNAVGSLHDGFDLDAPGELGLVLFAEVSGHLVENGVHDLLVDVELDGHGFKMERQRGVVADGVGE